MNGKLFIAANAIVLGAYAACSYDADPEPKPVVTVSVIADGVEITDAKDKIPADTQSVRVVAKVTAPPGTWQLKLSASGALSLQGASNGEVTADVVGRGDDDPVEIAWTAAPQPAGEAFIRASLDTFVKSWRFAVTPVTPRIQLCGSFDQGTCAPLPGGPAAEAFVDAAGVHWLALPAVAGGALRDGDRALIVVSTSPSNEREGVVWSGALTSQGALWLLDGDSQVRTRSIQFRADAGPVIVPVEVVGSGIARVAASIAGGPEGTLVVQGASAEVFPRKVAFVEHVGLQAKNRVSLCSSRSTGSLRVSMNLGGGSVVPTDVPIVATADGPCAAPFPGHAEVIWTGYDESPIWTVRDEASGAASLVAVPTLGTDAVVEVSEVSATLVSDASAEVVQVKGILRRNAYGSSSASPGEALASTDVVVKAPSGITVATAPVKTDANGRFVLELSKADWTGGATVELEVDHLILVPLLVEP